MIKFDITSAYHFIEVYRPQIEYLGFSWVEKDDTVTNFLCFPLD